MSNSSSEETPGSAELLIGAAIREYRQQRGYTLQELGNRAGVSKSFLSRLENGTVSASIPTLVQIARALRIRLGELFDELEERSSSSPAVVRAGDRKTVTRGGSAFGYDYEVLAHASKAAIEPFIVRFRPGERLHKPLFHEGYEFVFVIQGRVEFTHGDKAYTLEKGDSVCFDSSVPHRSVALGSEEAVLLSILVDEKR